MSKLPPSPGQVVEPSGNWLKWGITAGVAVAFLSAAYVSGKAALEAKGHLGAIQRGTNANTFSDVLAGFTELSRRACVDGPNAQAKAEAFAQMGVAKPSLLDHAHIRLISCGHWAAGAAQSRLKAN